MDGAGTDLKRNRTTLVFGVVAFVVVFAAVAGLVALRGAGPSGAQGAEGPGTYSRVLTTYEERVSANPGLSHTETFATLRCDPGDQL